MSAKQEILARIGTALTDRPASGPVERDYRTAGNQPPTGLVELFLDRLVDYHASAHRCTGPQAAGLIARVVAERGLRRLAVPAGVEPQLLAELTAEQLPDDPPLSIMALDQLDGVLTSCALGIAETGTIVLDAGPGQGRRALTLLPDYHLVVVRAEQLVAGVPDAIGRLDPYAPLTWISGPSATSDIELCRVEGVHGPRTLEVVLID